LYFAYRDKKVVGVFYCVFVRRFRYDLPQQSHLIRIVQAPSRKIYSFNIASVGIAEMSLHLFHHVRRRLRVHKRTHVFTFTVNQDQGSTWSHVSNFIGSSKESHHLLVFVPC
jgi:hypothetical protein